MQPPDCVCSKYFYLCLSTNINCEGEADIRKILDVIDGKTVTDFFLSLFSGTCAAIPILICWVC